MRTEKELSQEIRRIRERVKALSGFWISEFAAGISTLEWVLGKRNKSPSEDIGSAASGQGEIAKRLLDAVAKEARVPAKPKAVPSPPREKEARVSAKTKKEERPKPPAKKRGAGGGSRTHTPG
jgi:hypothetical protein